MVRVYCSGVLFVYIVRVYHHVVLYGCIVHVECSDVLCWCIVPGVLFGCIVRMYCSGFVCRGDDRRQCSRVMFGVSASLIVHYGVFPMCIVRI